MAGSDDNLLLGSWYLNFIQTSKPSKRVLDNLQFRNLLCGLNAHSKQLGRNGSLGDYDLESMGLILV